RAASARLTTEDASRPAASAVAPASNHQARGCRRRTSNGRSRRRGSGERTGFGRSTGAPPGGEATARGKPPPNLARPCGVDQGLLRPPGLRRPGPEGTQAVLASLGRDAVLEPESPELLEELLSEEEEELSEEDDEVEDEDEVDEPRLSVL